MRTIAIMIITVYVPLAGGINGGPLAANGEVLMTGHAACGNKYPFGTVFVILPDSGVSDYVGRTDFVCIDRGGAITNVNLDLAIVSPHIRRDLKTAFSWGRRKAAVEVWESGAKMKQYRRQMELMQ